MIIDCISDLHGHYPELKGGDLLIVAGDLTSRDIGKEYEDFNTWLLCQEYKKKVVIPGNHDNFLIKKDIAELVCMGAEYLCDSGTEFEGLKIWGSPWSKRFKGMNSHCMAFTVDTEEEIQEKWKLIPDDINILVTHEPPFGILDGIPNKYDGTLFHVGSTSLRNHVLNSDRFKNLKLHVFGHIHENGGKTYETTLTKFVNASHVNERYKPVNKPVRIVL